MKTYTEKEVRNELGQEVLDRLEKEEADYTNRVTGTDQIEFAARLELDDGSTVSKIWLFDRELVIREEDLGNLLWEDVAYYIIH